MTRHTRQRGGWIVVEGLAALGILATLLAGLMLSQWRIGEFNAVQLARERCVAAGQAQLESIAARGQTIDPERIERLWPGVRVSVGRSAGRGQWAADRGGLLL